MAIYPTGSPDNTLETWGASFTLAHDGVRNGTNSIGSKVSSGIYFYRLTAGKETISKKMVLLR